jgi:hypothetical protein
MMLFGIVDRQQEPVTKGDPVTGESRFTIPVPTLTAQVMDDDDDEVPTPIVLVVNESSLNSETVSAQPNPGVPDDDLGTTSLE